MINRINRRAFLGTTAIGLGAIACGVSSGLAQDKIKLRLSSPATPTDQRAVSLTEIFAPAIGRLCRIRAALERDAVQAGHGT